jgi:transcriptional regulator with XRE-family HTH domain
MTQAELGRRVGLTRQAVAAIEQGRYSSPSLDVAFRIALALGKHIDQCSSGALLASTPKTGTDRSASTPVFGCNLLMASEGALGPRLAADPLTPLSRKR